MSRLGTRMCGRLVAPVAVVAVLALAGQAAMVRRGVTGPVRYTVKAGDTLTRIAARYNVTVQQVAQANGVGNIHRIRIGDTLVIPVAATTNAATTRTGRRSIEPVTWNTSA